VPEEAPFSACIKFVAEHVITLTKIHYFFLNERKESQYHYFFVSLKLTMLLPLLLPTLELESIQNKQQVKYFRSKNLLSLPISNC